MVRRIADGQPESRLGPAMAEAVEAFARAWVQGYPAASKDAANKRGFRLMLSLLGELFASALHDVTGGAAADEAQLSGRPWLRGIDLLQEAETLLARNVAVPLLLDNLAIQWSSENMPQPAGR